MMWDAQFYNFSALIDVLIWLVYDHKTNLWKEYCTTFKIVEVAALVHGSPGGCFPFGGGLATWFEGVVLPHDNNWCKEHVGSDTDAGSVWEN